MLYPDIYLCCIHSSSIFVFVDRVTDCFTAIRLSASRGSTYCTSGLRCASRRTSCASATSIILTAGLFPFLSLTCSKTIFCYLYLCSVIFCHILSAVSFCLPECSFSRIFIHASFIHFCLSYIFLSIVYLFVSFILSPTVCLF